MVPLEVASSNRVLALLPPQDLKRMLPHLETRHVKARELLQPRGELADYAYFPTTSVASMFSLNELGALVEVATIGYEGMTGLSLFLGGESAALEVIMQVPGGALRMKADRFRRFSALPAFTSVLYVYTQALIAQIAQSSACNRMHPVEQRCARWLLQSHDRAKAEEFKLTHQFLGIMLGVRRASVTEVAGRLQERGLIKYHRGLITIVNRKGLEKAACDCYALITRVYDKLLEVKLARTRSHN